MHNFYVYVHNYNYHYALYSKVECDSNTHLWTPKLFLQLENLCIAVKEIPLCFPLSVLSNRQPTVNTRNPTPKPPTSSITFSSSSSKCHSQSQPAVDVTPSHTVLLHPAPHHHLLEERKREDSYDDIPDTVVVRHTERRQKGWVCEWVNWVSE